MFSDQLKSLAIFFFLVQVIRYFDLINPKYLIFVRTAYFLSQLTQLVLSYIISRRIRKKAERDAKIVVIVPAKPFSDESATSIEMTIEEYDSTNLLELVKQNLLNCAFLLFLHLKFEYTQPLILQAILPLKSFLSAPIVKIHLLGFPAVGDLSRPFPLPKSPFAAFFQNEQEEGVTDAPARTEQKSVEKSSEAQNDTLRMRKKGTPSSN